MVPPQIVAAVSFTAIVWLLVFSYDGLRRRSRSLVWWLLILSALAIALVTQALTDQSDTARNHVVRN